MRVQELDVVLDEDGRNILVKGHGRNLPEIGRIRCPQEAAGDERDILPHARVMVHDPLVTGGMGGSALHVETLSRNLMRTREAMAEILARHTGHSVETAVLLSHKKPDSL